MFEQRICLMRLKHMKFLRILVSPYKNWKIQREYHRYIQSDNCRRIQQLKNTHTGERCFIIGNGPSLRVEDLDKLKHEFTFAANRIYEIFESTKWSPTAYLAYDEFFLREENQKACQVPCEIRLLPFTFYNKRKKLQCWSGENTVLIWIGPKKFEINPPLIWADKSAYVPDDISFGFSNGGTVTFEAMQLAIYMGFKEIYLLGVDFNYSRVIDENGKIHSKEGVTDYFNHETYDSSLLYYIPVLNAYTSARKYCEQHDVIIRNATRGGKLEVFERVDFDGLF